MADIVAIQHIDLIAPAIQLMLQRQRQRGLAGARQAGQPDHAALVVVFLPAILHRHPTFHRADVGGDHGALGALVGVALHGDDAAADNVVAIDQHEPAGARVLLKLVQRQQRAGAQHHLGDRIALDSVAGAERQIADIDDGLDLLHLDREFAGRQLHLVGPALAQRRVAQPEQPRAEHIGFDRRGLGMADDLSALNEDRLVQRDADRLAGASHHRRRGCVPRLDAGDPRALVGRRDQDAVTDRQRATLDPAGKDTALVELIDILHRQAQRQIDRRRRRRATIQRLGDHRPFVPGHGIRPDGDIVALSRRNRHHMQRRDPDGGQIGADIRLDRGKARGIVAGHIHLVHRHHHLAHAQQMQQIAMPARLFLHAIHRIDHQHRGGGGGRAGDHVLQELLVTGRIDDEIGTRCRVETDLRRVDGDALVAFGLEGIQQEGPFERHAALFRHRLDGFQLAVGHRAGVVDQPSDQRGLAVIDMADDDDGQRAHPLDHALGRLAHHIYPAVRSRSKASSVSLSMARPLRSGTRVCSSSAMISSMVAASLATGWVMSMSPRLR